MISTLVSGAQIGPPTLREYAVDPELVATRSPSAQYVGRAVPSISTSIPSMEALTLETLVTLRAKGQKSLEGGFSIPTLSRARRSEEHTSELQSPDHIVCRFRLDKKNKTTVIIGLRDSMIFEVYLADTLFGC